MYWLSPWTLMLVRLGLEYDSISNPVCDLGQIALCLYFTSCKARMISAPDYYVAAEVSDSIYLESLVQCLYGMRAR